jgi:hypothetical protein
MTAKLIPILLWAYVLNLGIAFGAGLYESRIEAPRWLPTGPDGLPRWDRAAAVTADVGLRFWAFVSTVPLTLLTLAGLVVAWWAPGPVRAWWLAAALVCLAERAMTFGYFIPTMLGLMAEGVFADAEAAAKAASWMKLGWLRHAANAASWLMALQAFALWHARAGR